MREPHRNPKLPPIFCREFRSNMLTIGGRSRADIDRDIENRAPRASYELSLRVRWCLKMQPAQHAGLSRINVIILDERPGHACGRQNITATCFRKKTALVVTSDRFYQQDIFDSQ